MHVPTIYCIGRNYVAHVEELGNVVPGEPVVFLKAATTVRGLAPSPMAFPTETFDHEAELVLRIGRPVPVGGPAGWPDVDGFTLGLDLTRRAIQRACKERRLPWTPAKSFAGSAVLAPMVAAPPAPPFRFSLTVGGELRQSGDTRRLIFDVPRVLTYLASLAPLGPGDLVFTGTPEGVGPLRVGDDFALALSDATGASWTWAGTL